MTETLWPAELKMPACWPFQNKFPSLPERTSCSPPLFISSPIASWADRVCQAFLIPSGHTVPFFCLWLTQGPPSPPKTNSSKNLPDLRGLGLSPQHGVSSPENTSQQLTATEHVAWLDVILRDVSAFILTVLPPGGCFCYPHFTDEETKAHRGQAPGSRSRSW